MTPDQELKLRCLEVAERTVTVTYNRSSSSVASEVINKDMTEILKRATRFEDFVTGKTTIDSTPGLIDRLRDVLCKGE